MHADAPVVATAPGGADPDGTAVPWMVHNPAGRAPVLVVCDHATRRIPPDMARLGLDDWVLDTHVAWDIGAAEVACRLALLLDAPAILSGFSRLVADPKRSLDLPEAIPAISAGISIPGNLDLTDADRDRRARDFWLPYHRGIDAALAEFARRGIVPAFISVHSCTPVYDRVVRPWHIGVMWDRDPRLGPALIDALDAWGDIHVGDNEPYSGKHPFDYTVDHHAEAAGLPCVGLEIRQNLIADTGGANDWSDLLARCLRPILARDNLYRRLSRVH